MYEYRYDNVVDQGVIDQFSAFMKKTWESLIRLSRDNQLNVEY